MSEAFHWVIFIFHAAAALLITFGVWFRCDPGHWVSYMYVDTYQVQPGSPGLWWDDRDARDFAECSAVNSTNRRSCFDRDLPLYERAPSGLGWQVFGLLGHFEWISAAFALFYVKSAWYKSNWWVCTGVALLGTVLYMPFRGPVLVNQAVLQVVNFLVCAGVFYGYKDVYRDPASRSELPSGPSEMTARADLGGEGNLVPTRLRDAQLPALRFSEYCITASELWVAVLAVYVQDAPAFMSLGGYTLILLTNLYGVLLHYSLISDNVQAKLDGKTWSVPQQYTMFTQMATGAPRKGLRVPESMLGAKPAPGLADSLLEMMQRRVWGSYIASNTSTLLNAWLAYLVAIGLIFYQQTFLWSKEPPAFVVFAGWSLIVSYSSFGIWMTLVYWYPGTVTRLCCCVGERDTFKIALYGLDVLSLSAKLSIVGSLSYGFVFRAEGRC